MNNKFNLEMTMRTVWLKSRKTECGAEKFLKRLKVRAAPFALIRAVCLMVFLALAGTANAQTKIPKTRSGVSTCKNRCKVQYNFCKSHATTKGARKSCGATRKSCKGQCG